MTMKQEFRDYIFATNTDGSGKASSYIRALDMLGPILTKHYPKPIVGGTMWHSFSMADIRAIHRWICAEQRKGADSPMLADFESPSYWTKNFCSAAIRAYGEFLATEQFEDSILSTTTTITSGKRIAKTIENLIEAKSPDELEKHLHLTAKKGKMKLATVKVRVNHDLFRKMVLANFDKACCLTGLRVPEVLRASHISPWAEDETNRLNPENGICLSATYDAAFDKHLISFDDDLRLIVSKSIKDHYTDKAAKTWFLDREGQKMSAPIRFQLSQKLLAAHRDLLIC